MVQLSSSSFLSLHKKLLSGTIFIELRFIIHILGTSEVLLYINSPRISTKSAIFPCETRVVSLIILNYRLSPLTVFVCTTRMFLFCLWFHMVTTKMREIFVHIHGDLCMDVRLMTLRAGLVSQRLHSRYLNKAQISFILWHRSLNILDYAMC